MAVAARPRTNPTALLSEPVTCAPGLGVKAALRVEAEPANVVWQVIVALAPEGTVAMEAQPGIAVPACSKAITPVGGAWLAVEVTVATSVAG